MLPDPNSSDKVVLEQGILVILLLTGLYFPTSINGEHNIAIVVVAFAILFTALAFLAGKYGIDLKTAVLISLPIMIVLTGCTFWGLVSRPFEIDAGLFIKFCALTLILTLNLRTLRPGPFVEAVFALTNSVNIMGGIAILAGNEWIADFIPKYYWTSDAGLMPRMLSLHKPVLTFGSHALAGFFLYLFFWVNWERYRSSRSRLALLFALCYFILLLGVASFSSIMLGFFAVAQMAVCFWRRPSRQMAAIALGVAVIIVGLSGFVVSLIDGLSDWPQFAEGVFLNSDMSGPLSRYGPDGVLRSEVNYLFSHPLSPIGFERCQSTFDVSSPKHFFVGDSGPLEYLVRGSVPLLFFIYLGLYRFLQRNLLVRTQALMLFLVFITFETGFSVLSASRTYFLLPFAIIYLNQTVSVKGVTDVVSF